jgi:hypothetical protein
MKKILLSAILCSSLFASKSIAQLPDGSVAPNFTTTDVNGNSHTLYDYLDQGYTVVLDISATWCGPCWNYHTGGALEDLWENHGPAGEPGVSANTTDDVVVLWFEGDSGTALSELENSNLGNWLLPNGNTVNFPMCNDDNIAQLYNLPYWPIIYTICPNRILTESGQLSATAHYNGASNCESASGANNGSILGYTGETITCGEPVALTIDLQNMGTENLTGCTINVLDGGTNVLSYNWTGNLSPYNVESVTLGTVNPTSTTTYSIELSADDNASDNTTSATINTAQETASTITVEVLTDTYADEVWMEITNSNGAVVWSEGNENVQGNYGTGQFPPPADPTNPLANSTDYSWPVALPAVDCYTFTIYDYYGDGLQEGGGGSWSIKDNNGTVILSESDVNYGAMDSGLIKNTTASLDEMAAQNVQVYPNPATDVLNVSFENTNDTYVSVMDLQGRVLSTQMASGANGTQVVSISIEGFAIGTYVVSVQSNGLTSNSNVVIK